MRSVSGLVLALLGATGVAAAEDTARPVDVHFTARATDGAAIRAAAKARQSEAARKAKELEHAYTAQYGKDHGKWPADKRAELDALRAEPREDAAAAAAAAIEADYASAPPKTLAESARDLAKGTMTFGSGLLRAVERADQAHLVVEVTGQRSWASKSWLDSDDQFSFILRLSAGSKLAEGRLHGAAVRWPEDEEMDIVVVHELHGYSDDEPYWLLQIQGGDGFGSLANRTDGILADFVRMNGSLFAGK